MKISKGSKLVMIGDSITDCGRVRTIAEGFLDALGSGYVNMIDALLGAVYPQLGIRIINVGNSGNTVRDLKERWKQDVLNLKPDWVSVMIGTNDVWRQFKSPANKEIHVLPREFEATLAKLVANTRPMLKGMILITPFFIEPDPQDAMRARMDEYGAIVRKLAKKYDTIFVDTQASFDDVLKFRNSGSLSSDRVHPSQTGHMIIARAILKAIGFEC